VHGNFMNGGGTCCKSGREGKYCDRFHGNFSSDCT
jgi:hypothetical protein